MEEFKKGVYSNLSLINDKLDELNDIMANQNDLNENIKNLNNEFGTMNIKFNILENRIIKDNNKDNVIRAFEQLIHHNNALHIKVDNLERILYKLVKHLEKNDIELS